MIDISGIDKAELLAGLVNAAKPAGWVGVLSKDEAQQILDEREPTDRFFDHIRGRSLECWFDDGVLDHALYDLENGQGCAAAVVHALRTGAWPMPTPPEAA